MDDLEWKKNDLIVGLKIFYSANFDLRYPGQCQCSFPESPSYVKYL